MASDYQVKVESEPDPTDMHALVKGLVAFNASQTDGEQQNNLLVTVRDDTGALMGGLLGATYLGWLTIQIVWLDDAARGKGYGSELMDLAEREAVRRGCPRAFVETLSFPALPFYEKCGYSVHSCLPDFPPGGARYSLTKQLS